MSQRTGPLADTANRVVFRNVRGNGNFVKEKLVSWWNKDGMVHRIVFGRYEEDFGFLFYAYIAQIERC